MFMVSLKDRSNTPSFFLNLNIIVREFLSMRIGNNELNENEAEWAVKFADNIANQALKQCISSLNAKFEVDQIKEFLVGQWTQSTPVVEPEPEPDFEEDDE